jgi:Ferric reductase NAD binding domain
MITMFYALHVSVSPYYRCWHRLDSLRLYIVRADKVSMEEKFQSRDLTLLLDCAPKRGRQFSVARAYAHGTVIRAQEGEGDQANRAQVTRGISEYDCPSLYSVVKHTVYMYIGLIDMCVFHGISCFSFRYYCQINIYITGVEKTPKEVRPLYRPKKAYTHMLTEQSFTADELYAMMLNPTVESKGQIKKMKKPNPANRLQDIWVWNGRPYWDEVFEEMAEQRQHPDIGVCFCGAAVIGADLKTMCEKHSSVENDVLFTLHKENF